MSNRLTFLFAFAGGVAVANLYWAQPLLAEIASFYGVSTGAAGLLITVTQLGYALGVFLIVPLGDVLDRRKIIPSVMLCSGIVLVVSSAAPNFEVFMASMFVIGITTVTGQLLTPLAGDLAVPEQRGRVVGFVVSGLLVGILSSRTISGLVSDLYGWQAIFRLAALASVVMAAILFKSVPSDPKRPALPYGTLLSSVFGAVRRHQVVRVTLLLGAIAFSVFTIFWTGLTFLLSAAPFSYSLTQIGLVGLVGLAGAFGAQRSGVLHDIGWSGRGTGLALGFSMLSVLIAYLGAASISAVLLAVLLLDIAIQAVNVLNQTRLFSVDPASRSRLNTAFIMANFMGGAVGSTLAGLLWEHGGWGELMLCAGSLLILALLVWAPNRESLDLAFKRETEPPHFE